jgi:hypothetical protein
MTRPKTPGLLVVGSAYWRLLGNARAPALNHPYPLPRTLSLLLVGSTYWRLLGNARAPALNHPYPLPRTLSLLEETHNIGWVDAAFTKCPNVCA